MIYIVSGVPRSFTSAMMKALHIGGLPAVKSTERDRLGKRLSTSTYEANPNGELWEPSLKDVTQMPFPIQFPGCVIKVLAAWLPCLWVHEYRVVFLLRNPIEVRNSFDTMLHQEFSESDVLMHQQFGMEACRNRRDIIGTSVFQTEQLLRDPLWVFKTLVRDGWPIGPAKAARHIEPHRKRSVA